MANHDFTPLTQKVFRQAWAIAGALGHAYVGTEHLLLGLLRTPECSACRLLLWQGAEPERLVLRLVRESGQGSRLLRLPQGFSAEASVFFGWQTRGRVRRRQRHAGTPAAWAAVQDAMPRSAAASGRGDRR